MDVLYNVVNGRICLALYCAHSAIINYFLFRRNILIESVEDATFNVDTLHSLNGFHGVSTK